MKPFRASKLYIETTLLLRLQRDELKYHRLLFTRRIVANFVASCREIFDGRIMGRDTQDILDIQSYSKFHSFIQMEYDQIRGRIKIKLVL